MSNSDLKPLFNPSSVAVIGASSKKGKIGHDVLFNLREYGYKGRIYPINPNDAEIMGEKCYPSVLDVKEDIDLAVFAIPAAAVIEAMKECGKKRIGAAIVITAGFKETGPEGKKLELELAAVAKEHGIRVLGPNCLGFISSTAHLNASFAAVSPLPGDIAFFSQSGALCSAILDWAVKEKIGFSKFISIGNKADISETDLLKSLGDDPDTKVVLGYIEDVKDGKEFMRVAREVTAKKPVIICKSGGSKAGAKAASSHTGSLAGSDAAFDAAFAQTGIIRAETIEDLFDYAVAFSYQKLPKGPNLAIITNAGGPGIIAVDAVERSKYAKVASLGKETTDYLRGALPKTAALNNPVDVVGDADDQRYKIAVGALLKDPGVDGLIVILTPQSSSKIKETADVLVSNRDGKPIFSSFIGGELVDKGVSILQDNKIPNYRFPERAISSFDIMVKHKNMTDLPKESVKAFRVDKDKVKKIIDEAIKAGQKEIPEYTARGIIESYGFRIPKSTLAKDAAEAVAAADKTGYPVVMKIASPDILHKSDVGGVKVGLKDAAQVEAAFNEMVKKAKAAVPNAKILGVLIQEMAMGGKEVILGMTRDPQFGPMLMFGLGGIYVEVLKDVAFRIAPITPREAGEMVDSIKSVALLKGARGEKPADIDSIKEGLLRLSQMVTDFPMIKELDINPLKVFSAGDKGGSIAIDARISIDLDKK
ncbi:MAG TPA: acetate--CoA ligase family protein [Candidatus Omnitrophota bacterium]|nr:acetate--CoA ligase family protein [Candidatus Omnitrophota bacterium]HPN66317.1 acetate--CoA ligase family protein [Candidatus Omnitrophota bacterium]